MPSGPEDSSQAALHLGGGQAEDRCHGAGPLLSGGQHQLSPTANQAGGIHWTQSARGNVGAVLAEAVARGRTEATEPTGNNREHRHGVGQDCGLGVVGEGELVLWSLPHDTGEPGVERVIDGRESFPRRRKAFREVLPHADTLCPLAGAHQDRHHRMTALPQVNPAPKATSRRREPGFTRPSLMA